MDIIERFHQKFGRWYERLFNDAGEQALRPKDVLRKILDAMEQHRNEGFDGKVYVPNKYLLELAVSDPEEHDYLLSFLDEEELTGVLQRYMAQNGYAVRGPLDFTIVEVSPDEADEKLTVKVRFEKGSVESGADRVVPSSQESPLRPEPAQAQLFEDDEMLTVASVPQQVSDEDMTIAAIPMAWAALVVTSLEGNRSLATMSKPEFSIGRSRQAGNDLVLASDGQASKRHARIERETDGKATIYDVESTNGVYVNGRLISGNAALEDGDEILIGTTKIIFQQDIAPEDARPGDDGRRERAPSPTPLKRAQLIRKSGGSGYALASDTLIGKAVTCDLVLGSTGASMRQAQIISPDGANYYLQDLAGKQTTRVNGRPLYGEEKWRLQDADVIEFSGETYTYQAPESFTP